MFHIRSEQWNTFSEQDKLDFERRLTEHLMEVNPECFVLLEEEMITQIIRDSIRKAVAYGIEAEPNVAQFVQMQLEERYDFENKLEYAASKAILDDTKLDEYAKIRQLWRSVEDVEDSVLPAEDDMDEDVELDEQDLDLAIDDLPIGQDVDDEALEDDADDDDLDFDDEEEDDEKD